MNYEVGIAAILFVLYWYLLPPMIDVMLEVPKLKHAHWFLIGILNTFIVFGIVDICGNIFLAYFIMMLLMLIDYMIFYQDKLGSAMLCTLACAIHVLLIFTTTIGVLALITAVPPYDILTNHKMFILAVIISFILLDLVILSVIKLVPLAMVKLINQHKEQQGFIIAWLVVNIVFLLYMASKFCIPEYPEHESGIQIAASMVSMISLYIILFFSFKTSSILGYKEKNEALEHAINQEQQYRISMVKDAITFYEVNVTKDFVIKGFEDERKELDQILRYSDMLNLVARKIVHPEEVDEFIYRHKCENVIKQFKNGESESSMEYRRLMADGAYIWVKAIVNLVEDIENGDIKAFVCIKNINAEKKNQLELQRLAERDVLTGLYNKNMVSRLIDEHLANSSSSASSAFFMIDVDDFKNVNDHLGHVYGDAVLCELGEKLVRIFRSTDIVGRIGGDEFIVFLKNGAIARKVEEKAKEICKAFYISYKGLNGEEYTISSSIGISISPQDGSSFAELYNCADIALYAAKNEGKNTYKVYDGSSFTGYTSQRTEIEPLRNISQKGFRHNRIEYVFKMLYHSENTVAAIYSALELVASHFLFERGYIFETSKDGKTISNTFEWCAQGIAPQRKNLQEIPIETVVTASLIMKNIDDVPLVERALLEPHGIKSMFQFGIFNKNQLLGFIGFANCKSETIPSDSEIDDMETICNILATFFVKHHVDEAANQYLFTRQEMK